MSNTLRQARARCRAQGRNLLEQRRICHLDPTHHSDGCGYFKGKYAYLQVDCREVRGRPRCRLSIYDHYSGDLLYSTTCPQKREA